MNDINADTVLTEKQVRALQEIMRQASYLPRYHRGRVAIEEAASALLLAQSDGEDRG